MKKIPSIFVRKRSEKMLSRKINPVCQWVFDGEGVATRKYDGTCCMFRNGSFYKRLQVRPGKAAPDGYIEADFDEKTGKSFGWILVNPAAKENRYHIEALLRVKKPFKDGAYELLGPKINGNPENFSVHELFPHSEAEVIDVPIRTYDGIKSVLSALDIEGLIFKHDDGRMAKIKKTDYGMAR